MGQRSTDITVGDEVELVGATSSSASFTLGVPSDPETTVDVAAALMKVT